VVELDRFHEYGMVTVQVAVNPERVAVTDAVSVMKFRVAASSVEADASHRIFAVLARVDETVMVKLKTNLPPKLAGGGTSAS
jgi:hypothetical protein